MNKQNIINKIKSSIPEMVAIRHHLHEMPELGFEENQTSAFIAEKLKSWGYDVVTHIAGTGLVATITVGEGKKIIGFRADMDALPIDECTKLTYQSQNEGIMHACGHDGHMATLLTAAKYLGETKNFSGTIHLIFQPAEEGLGGAKKMVDDEKLFERFPCDVIYGYHNVPGIPLGKICLLKGAATAASDRARIIIKGKSGHGAQPHLSVDPIIVGASMVTALQTIVSRNMNPLESGVITVGSFCAGDAYNIIPETAELRLTIRSYDQKVRDLFETRIKQLAKTQAESFGAEVEIDYWRINPQTMNDSTYTDFVRDVAQSIFGEEAFFKKDSPFTFSDDFSFMTNVRPGCYVFIGNGDSAQLHNDHYDFNDKNLETGGVLWAALAEKYLQA